MKFLSKITLALAAGSMFCPLVAQAAPVTNTGSTAAAVSIKFEGTSNGNFSIQPGSNAYGGGTGVRELSAAVATGETQSDASSSSTKFGTTATAKGFSQPVTFTYSTYSDISNISKNSEFANSSQSQKNSASQSANSQDGFTNTASSRNADNASNNTAQKNSASQSANSQDGSTITSTGKNADINNSNKNGTSYNYTGSSAGLSFIPLNNK